MVGHCGAKRIFKPRNTKHTMLGALLEVGVRKNGRSLWGETYFQIKRYKAHHARSTFGSWGVEKWQVTVVPSVFQIKKYKAHHARSTFGSWGVEKWQVTVARGVFSKQEIQSTPCSEHFWKLKCGAMAGRCGAKHIFKSRDTKHTMLGALLEVGAWKNGRSLWCEAYFQIKKYKAHHARSTFGSWGVEKWQVTVERSVFSNQEIQSTPRSEQFWKLGRGKMAGHCRAKHISNQEIQSTPCSEHFWKLGCGKWQVTVARSIFSNQEIQSTPCSRHFWKLGCGKIAGHCGAKHIFKSRDTKHTMLGALLEVGAWKNGRSPWSEAYFQNKKYKAYHARSTFGSWGVEKWQITVERSMFSNQEIQSTACLEHFWKFRCEKSANGCAKHICKSKCKKNRFRISFEGIDVEKL